MATRRAPKGEKDARAESQAAMRAAARAEALRGRRNTMRAIVFGVGLVASVVGAALVWTSVSNRVLSGRLDDAFITSKGIVGVVAIVHSGGGDGSSADYRLTLIDAATGRRQARRVLGSSPPKCAELRPGRLWCRAEDGLVLLDVATLEVKSDWAALQRSMPMLAVGLVGMFDLPENKK